MHAVFEQEVKSSYIRTSISIYGSLTVEIDMKKHGIPFISTYTQHTSQYILPEKQILVRI